MRKLLLFAFTFSFQMAFGQYYFGDNTIFFKFETLKGTTIDFVAHKMSTRFALDVGQIEFEADVKTFKPYTMKDTVIEFEDVLSAEDYEDIIFKSDLPSPIQIQNNTPQRMLLNGQFFIGNAKKNAAMNIIFMPKDQSEMEFEFTLAAELKDFGIEMPEKLKSKINGRFKLTVIDGKCLGKL